MRLGHVFFAVAVSAVTAGATIAAAAPPASAGTPATADIAAAVRTACAERGQPGPCRLESTTSVDLGSGVTEYTYVLRVGPQSHDRIALHRIVTGAAGRRAVFMLPGDSWGFDAAFAGQIGAATRTSNVATYLAHNGIDVWGLDMRWVLVPGRVPVADTGFMASWGFATMLSDIRLGTAVERAARESDGARDGRTALVGWSRGGELAYAYAAQESQLDPADRNVTSLVPVDIASIYAPDATSEYADVCRTARQERRALRDGSAVDLHAIATWGAAALRAPDRTSHDYPSYTNRQVGLFVGGFGPGPSPWFHYLGETVDSQSVPTGTRYTPEASWYGFMTQIAPYEALAVRADGDSATCDAAGSAFFAHVGDVDVPLLYVGAAGGFGTTGVYQTTLVRSTDVTSLIVRVRPAGHEMDDLGHVDLWYATNAQTLVWKPLATWLKQH